MGKLFGTDGVRGTANIELTPELAFELGRAGAYVITKEKKHRPKILVGLDTRVSGDMLESALTAGMCSVGAHVFYAGVLPTPGIAHLTRHYNMDAGVVISASHNIFSDNGIKFFNSDGYKLPDSLEDEIENIIAKTKHKEHNPLPKPHGADIGRKFTCADALEDYVSFLYGTTNIRLDGLKIALDCANGATYQAAPAVFRRLGASVYAINDCPDGMNINQNCGSVHTESLSAYVREISADIGLAFDGDGDRLIVVDNNGEVLSGDEILAILALDLKSRKALVKDTLVITVMSNLGLKLFAKAHGITLRETNVGDRYVLEEMLKGAYSLGGEQSGHIIMLDYNTTGDGVLTAIQLTAIMQRIGSKVSQLHDMPLMPQVLVNAVIDNSQKAEWLNDETIKNEIAQLESKLCGNGRVLIRPSGTEPLIRIMLEGADKAWLEQEARRLAAIIEKRLRNEH